MVKVLFIQSIGYPYLGPMSLSAVLKANGHSSEALIGERPEDLLPILRKEKPQIVGFPVMTGMHLWAREMSALIKEQLPETLVVWGGPHPTFTPEVIREPGIDIVCRGEAEDALLELANAVETNAAPDHIANLWVKKADGTIIRNDVRPLVEDLDSIPFPDRDLYRRHPDVGRSTTQVFMAGRGCPFDCTYCFNHTFREIYRNKGRLVRYRSVHHLLDEIKQVAARMKVRNVYLNDDTLILNRKWVIEFTGAYPREIHIPFTCLIRADLTDEELIRRMAGAGCRSVFFGIETGSERLRNEVLRKKVTDEEIVRTAQWLKKYRIKFRTYNMLGLPGETLDDALRTLEMNIRIKSDFPWAAIFMPYPGTELGDRSKTMGLLDPTFSADDVKVTFHSTSVLKLPHRREIDNLHKFFQTAVLFPWTLPLIKRLIRLPPNKFFVFWFTLVYGYFFIRSESRGWWETIFFGLKNLKHLAPSLFHGRQQPPMEARSSTAGA